MIRDHQIGMGDAHDTCSIKGLKKTKKTDDRVAQTRRYQWSIKSKHVVGGEWSILSGNQPGRLTIAAHMCRLDDDANNISQQQRPTTIITTIATLYTYTSGSIWTANGNSGFSAAVAERDEKRHPKHTHVQTKKSDDRKGFEDNDDA